jgi:hypothetical protein
MRTRIASIRAAYIKPAAVAIEVERIGEGQRFITRFFTENSTLQAPGEERYGAGDRSERDGRCWLDALSPWRARCHSNRSCSP